jgi:TrmH family RNA methyltransferase
LETLSPKDRKEAGYFVVEGLRAVTGILDAPGVGDVEIFCTSEWIERFPDANLVSDEVAKKIADTVTPQGIFAVAPISEGPSPLGGEPRVALFFEMQDPGNAGTVLRSAHAFGIDAVVFAKGSVDPYGAKVVRASAGSISSVPILFGVDGFEVIESLKSSHQIVAFDMAGSDISQMSFTRPTLMIFGNEARGLPREVTDDQSIEKVRIPMAESIESLNVASAATIAMYEISRRD